MRKYDDLEKLQQLEKNGVLTDEEFKAEKIKILNTDNNQENMNNNKSKNFAVILFIVAVICLILTIIFACLEAHYGKLEAELDIKDTKATISYNAGLILEKEYNEIHDEWLNVYRLWNFFNIIKFITGTITLFFLIIAITLTIRKGKKRNVDM